jgi:hypothetical protein
MEIEPGKFRDMTAEEILASAIEIDDEWSPDPNYYANASPNFSDQLIKIYKKFQETFGVPQRVFYPCCDLDASPVRAFPDSEVTLLDINEEAVGVLKRNGISAIAGDVRKHRPRPKNDLLILLNPCISTGETIHTVRRSGLVLANNYHGNVSQMFQRPLRYAFQGVFDDRGEEIRLGNKKEAMEIYGQFCDFFSVFRKRF